MRSTAMLRFFTLAGLCGALAALAFACGEDAGTEPPDNSALLRTLTESVILPEHASFTTSADALAAALAALETSPTADSLASAQAAWRTARAAYRKLDALHFGPVADLSIGERIDLAPAKSADIEALIAATAPLDASTVSNAGGHSKGFLGIEYLIFSDQGADTTLAQLQGDGAPSRRRSLAHLMAGEIASSAHQLEDAWAPGKGNYAGEIENAGATSARYPSQRAALDDLVGGVAFSFEIIVGVRLSAPLGRRGNGSPDPSQDPTAMSDSTAADLQATIEGIHALYDGAGLSSLVRPKSTVLDNRMGTQLGSCASTIKAMPTPFVTALTTATATVQSAYDACKTTKSTWNTDITSALGATLKPTDNDGD